MQCYGGGGGWGCIQKGKEMGWDGMGWGAYKGGGGSRRVRGGRSLGCMVRGGRSVLKSVEGTKLRKRGAYRCGGGSDGRRRDRRGEEEVVRGRKLIFTRSR